MELWIRSKDEMKLVKANNIVVKEAGNLYWIYSNEILVGQYIKTRALEVLDEIEKYIEKQGTMEIDLQNGGKYYGKVYEMPEK